ncbi:hypothetical protein Tcan_02666 [Toxocara canis]|uniref:Uncharacterized protein n=1 Tax=Toxocara canis TaxID=6265 RepID=A0A0B2UQV0_TOXCA|nr:hypothetical protein Tcan_02666 [Toxocara canis]
MEIGLMWSLALFVQHVGSNQAMPVHASTALARRHDYYYYAFQTNTVNSSMHYEDENETQRKTVVENRTDDLSDMVFKSAKDEFKATRRETKNTDICDDCRYIDYIQKTIMRNSRSAVFIMSISTITTFIIISVSVAIAAVFECTICYEQYIPDDVVT